MHGLGNQAVVCLLAPWFLLGEKIGSGAGLFPVLVADGGCGQLQSWHGVTCPGTKCGLRDNLVQDMQSWGTGAGATSEWVGWDFMALTTPIPPLLKMETSQDHFLPALALCLGVFSSDPSPSHSLRCCVFSLLLAEVQDALQD